MQLFEKNLILSTYQRSLGYTPHPLIRGDETNTLYQTFHIPYPISNCFHIIDGDYYRCSAGCSHSESIDCGLVMVFFAGLNVQLSIHSAKQPDKKKKN